MFHGTISGLGTPVCRCENCGATGTFKQLNSADDCPGTFPLDVEDCPTCGGTGQVANWLLGGDDGKTGDVDCPGCNGYGVVKSNQNQQNGRSI